VQERRERPALRQAVAALLHQNYRLFYAALLAAPLALTIGAEICAMIVLGIAAARPDPREEHLGAAPAPRPAAVPTA
jgi:hypothetical protein